MNRWLSSIAVGLLVVACGDSGSGTGGGVQGGSPSEGGNAPAGGNASDGGNAPEGGTAPEGGSPGAGGAGGAPHENPLGQPCGDGLPECAAPTDCVIQPLIGGSETQGYCSPACTMPNECTDGYEGPGETTCYGGTCVFTCASDDECPEGLSCLETGGPTEACGVAAE
jgi:hypothetical protein